MRFTNEIGFSRYIMQGMTSIGEAPPSQNPKPRAHHERRDTNRGMTLSTNAASTNVGIPIVALRDAAALPMTQRGVGRDISIVARVFTGLAAIVWVAVLHGCAPPVAPPPLGQPVASPREKARQGLGLTSRETRLEFRTQPQAVIANSPALWSLKVLETKRKPDGKSDYVRSFESQQGQLMHLVVVARDGSFFKHLNPEYKDYGHFLIETTLPASGRYQLFADYTPYKGREEVARQQLVVAPAASNKASGASSKTPAVAQPFSLRADAMKEGRIVKFVTAPSRGLVIGQVLMLDGGQVTLMPLAGNASTGTKGGIAKIVAGRETRLNFQVRDGEGAVRPDLPPDLATASQCFIVSGDGAIYLHPKSVSPPKNGADIGFTVSFPAPGIYRVWLEFPLRGEAWIAPFVVNVAS